MTAPKLIVPGQSVSITIRTLTRQMYLVPDEDGEKYKVMGYLIGYALLCSNVVMHGFCTMSNHLHYTATDLDASRGRFTQRFHGAVAKKHNQWYEREGTFWGKHSEQIIMHKDAMENKLLYDWLNPVKANLVERVDDWEGFMILPKHWGKPMTFKRPPHFPEDTWPPCVTFTPMPPAFFHEMPLDEVVAFFEDKIAQKEAKYHEERNGKKVVGMAACFLVDPASKPGERPLSLHEQRQARRERRKLKLYARQKRSENVERIVHRCKVKTREIRKRYHQFYRDYRDALEAYKSDKSTRFPIGTFQKVYREGALCENSCPDDSILPSAYDNHYLEWYQARFGPDGHESFDA